MKKYKGKLPLNARVTVDYSKKQPSVRFSYPQTSKILPTVFFPIFIFWLLVNGLLVFVLTLAPATANFNPVAASSTLVLTVAEYFPEILYFFGTPFLASMIISKNYTLFSGLYPKMMYYFYRLFGKPKFRREVRKLKKNIFEIPLFSNIMLSYNSSGDFSSMLKKIKVVEHDINIKKGRIISRNDTYWKALFFFDNIPKRGRLIVEYM